MHIHLKDKAVPTRISTARQVPLRFQEAADSTLLDLIASGVVVRENEPTDWCSPAFFVPKACGKKVRLVTDYTRLNRYVKRPVHPFPSVRDIVQCIPTGMCYFANPPSSQPSFCPVAGTAIPEPLWA